ncbi:protein NO VEIN domain-containing protein [Nocardia sp. IFM 10818]
MDEYSDLTPTQYDTGYVWLRDVGLLSDVHASTPAAGRVFDAAIAHSQASWLPDADTLIGSPEELPADVRAVAQGLSIEDEVAFSRLSAVWGKVDTDERLRIGNAGELAVVRLLTEAVPNTTVDHVASWSDGFGYDIAVSCPTGEMHLEVKTTLRRGRLSFYLSRNEFRVMQHDAAWSLLVVRLNAQLEPLALATVPNEWVATHVPLDRTALGKWQSCRLDVPPHVPVPGIPISLPISDQRAALLLQGKVGWPGNER